MILVHQLTTSKTYVIRRVSATHVQTTRKQSFQAAPTALAKIGLLSKRISLVCTRLMLPSGDSECHLAMCIHSRKNKIFQPVTLTYDLDLRI